MVPVMKALSILFAVLFITLPLVSQEPLTQDNQKEAEAKQPQQTQQTNLIDLGTPQHLFTLMGGLNTLAQTRLPGGFLSFSYQYATNFTRYDAGITGYIVPDYLGDSTYEASQFALLKFKDTKKYFDWPFIYNYTLYSLKANTEENLNGRALIDSGFGFEVWSTTNGRTSAMRKAFSIDAETAVVFDYASLKAYADNISSFYLKTMITMVWRYNNFKGIHSGTYLYDVMADNSIADQSRVELEGELRYLWQNNFYIAFGSYMTHYVKLSNFFINLTDGQLIRESKTFYLTAVYTF